MKTYAAISFLLLTVVGSGVAAQTQPTEHPSTHPLNLSVRKPALPATEPAVMLLGNDASTNVQIGPDSVNRSADDAPVGMRYGAGYESRTQGSSTGDGGTSAGSGSSSKSGSESNSGKGSGRGSGKGDGKGH
jgi:hypothetical protein